MPLYEYEPVDRDCLMCDGRVGVLQGVHDDPCQFCPWCGLEVKRIVSSASFKVSKDVTPEKAAARGFTTFKKTDTGVWEKVAGEGDQVIERESETPVPQPKILDLDSDA